MKEFNFIHERLPIEDRERFFGPLSEKDEFIVFGDNLKWEDLWVHCGLFPSKSQARKNSHGGEIGQGWHDITKKKQGIRVCLLNLFPGWDIPINE